MKIKTIVFFIIAISCLIVYVFFAIQKETGQEFAVSINLASPLSIEWPCEVSIVGDSGENGFRIAPNIGRGWKGEAGGSAGYRFFIPQDGKYYIWAYCLWFDECTNAVFAQVDDQDKAIIGNDPVYNKWHWVRGFDINLKKGTHSITLSNHSDHISLQKIVFSNSFSDKHPEGLIFSDIFYDGFDGCDQGNFNTWQQIEGDWLVQNPDSETCLIENSLIGQSQNKALIIYKDTEWQNYSLSISLKVMPFDSEGSVGICFGLNDQDSYYQLKIKPVSNSKTAMIMVINENLKTIYQSEHTFELSKWKQVQICLKKEFIEIILGNNDPVKIETSKKITGGIGLLLEGCIKAYFDDVHVREIINE